MHTTLGKIAWTIAGVFVVIGIIMIGSKYGIEADFKTLYGGISYPHTDAEIKATAPLMLAKISETNKLYVDACDELQAKEKELGSSAYTQKGETILQHCYNKVDYLRDRLFYQSNYAVAFGLRKEVDKICGDHATYADAKDDFL